jgi:hypothetical protein
VDNLFIIVDCIIVRGLFNSLRSPPELLVQGCLFGSFFLVDVWEHINQKEEQGVHTANDGEDITRRPPVPPREIIYKAAGQWGDDGTDRIEETVECRSFVVEDGIELVVFSLNQVLLLVHRLDNLWQHWNKGETLRYGIAAGGN